MSGIGSTLKNIKDESAKLWEALSVPTAKDENYRYTSLRDLPLERLKAEQQAFCGDVCACAAANLPKEFALEADEGAVVMVSAKGTVGRDGLNQIPPSVVFRDLCSLEKLDRELEEALRLPAPFKNDFFAALAAARFQNAVVLYVPRGVKVEKPLRALHMFDKDASSFFHRTVIVVGEGAEVQIADEFTGEGSGLACGLVQIIAKAGSRVKYGQFQNWAPHTQYFLRQHLVAHQDAVIEYAPVYAGGAKGQVRSEGVCAGRGSHIGTKGAIRGAGSQHFDFWMTVTHPVPHTTSGLDCWTVMGDRARAVFNGKIVILPEAPHTEAYQKNRNMLLSREAEIDTIPKLEIAVDDVKCAHGASVSSVQPDQLYYLQTRGISKRDAEEMIIRGFTAPVVEELTGEKLRARALHALNEKSEVQL